MAATDSDTQPSGTTPGGVVEFLLARIAEDEEAAHLAWAERAPFPSEEPQPWMLYAPTDPRNDRFDLDERICIEPSRVLAECEAKRAIIEAHQRQVDDDDDMAWIVASEVLLRQLAAVYADHPDYDESWRP